MNVLPGLPYDGPEPDGFWSRDEYIAYLRSYVDHWRLPVRTRVTVVSVEQAKGEEHFIVRTTGDGQAEESVSSRSIVIASGMQRTPKFPPIRSAMPHDIRQLHTADYRSPSALPPGAVLVVGSAQSGCQIAEELLSGWPDRVSDVRAELAALLAGISGRELLEWWADMKLLDVPFASLEDKSISPRGSAADVGAWAVWAHSQLAATWTRQGASEFRVACWTSMQAHLSWAMMRPPTCALPMSFRNGERTASMPTWHRRVSLGHPCRREISPQARLMIN